MKWNMYVLQVRITLQRQFVKKGQKEAEHNIMKLPFEL